MSNRLTIATSNKATITGIQTPQPMVVVASVNGHALATVVTAAALTTGQPQRSGAK